MSDSDQTRVMFVNRGDAGLVPVGTVYHLDTRSHRAEAERLRAEAARLRAQGATYRGIAADLGVSYHRAYTLLNPGEGTAGKKRWRENPDNRERERQRDAASKRKARADRT